jgi:hypothetical protein
MKDSRINECRILEVPKIFYREGNISVIDGIKNIPFRSARIFYLYDIPAGETRGGHSHKECHQFMVAASGSFEVTLNDGSEKKSFFLNRPFYGLHIPPGIWAHEHNFSAGVICLVLTSDKFEESDYIRNYEEYLKIKHNG